MNDTILKDCPICHNFSLEHEEGTRYSFNLRAPIDKVRNQALKGCNGCKLLYQGSLQSLASQPESSVDEDECDIRAHVALGQAIDCVLTRFWDEGHEPMNGHRNVTQEVCHFQILGIVDQPNPWKTVAKISSTLQFVLTDEHREWYLSWVEDCVANHPHCQRPSVMPKRLIDLEADDKSTMCLREDIETTPYIALSHSWQFSEAQRSKTVRTNYESRKQFLPQQGLSKTFHDVISVTRWLGVRYLWIDTFCIIQDDPNDWAEQASRMGDIYEGAYITIAVHYDPSGSPDDGCFLDRKAFHKVDLPDDSGSQFSMFIKHYFIGQHEFDYRKSLMSRGWCVQERLLSPRILHFRPWEVIFECFTEKHCECEEMPLQVHDEHRLQLREKDLAHFFHLSEGEQDPNEDKYSWTWKYIVRVYSAANLTVPTDRLAALSSMIQRMPRQIFGDYLAGLWTNNLIEQLIWAQEDRSGKFFRCHEYVAPSFSWASIYGGPIRWLDLNLQYSERIERRARILDAGTVPAGYDPMGPVQEGFIRMRLRMIEARVTSIDSEGTNMHLHFPRKYMPYCPCHAHFDTEDDKRQLVGQEVYLGEVFLKTHGAMFLVMVKVKDREGAFQRVGIGSFGIALTKKDWWDGGYAFDAKHYDYSDYFNRVPEQDILLI